MRTLGFKPSALLQRSLGARTVGLAAAATLETPLARARNGYFERFYGHQPHATLQTYARNTHVTGTLLSGHAHWWATNPVTSTTLNFTSLA